MGIIIDMCFVFVGIREFNGDIFSWDVSKVIQFGFMFVDVWDFNGDISNWIINISFLVNMINMFFVVGIFD